MNKVVYHFIETHKSFGLLSVIYEFVLLVLNKFFRFEILKAMVVHVFNISDQHFFSAPGFQTRFLSHTETESISSDSKYLLNREFLLDAFKKKDRCYGVFDGDTLASYGWYSEQPTLIDSDFILNFDKQYSYMYNGYTLPKYRGKRLHAVGMCCALKELTANGKLGLVSFVDSKNFASLRSTQRMGYKIFGSLILIDFFGLKLSFATPGCKRYRFFASLNK